MKKEKINLEKAKSKKPKKAKKPLYKRLSFYLLSPIWIPLAFAALCASLGIALLAFLTFIILPFVAIYLIYQSLFTAFSGLFFLFIAPASTLYFISKSLILFSIAILSIIIFKSVTKFLLNLGREIRIPGSRSFKSIIKKFSLYLPKKALLTLAFSAIIMLICTISNAKTTLYWENSSPSLGTNPIQSYTFTEIPTDNLKITSTGILVNFIEGNSPKIEYQGDELPIFTKTESTTEFSVSSSHQSATKSITPFRNRNAITITLPHLANTSSLEINANNCNINIATLINTSNITINQTNGDTICNGFFVDNLNIETTGNVIIYFASLENTANITSSENNIQATLWQKSLMQYASKGLNIYWEGVKQSSPYTFNYLNDEPLHFSQFTAPKGTIDLALSGKFMSESDRYNDLYIKEFDKAYKEQLAKEKESTQNINTESE